jgi:hypothetical protein
MRCTGPPGSSHHPARAIARRLPPSAEISGSSRFDPVGPSQTEVVDLEIENGMFRSAKAVRSDLAGFGRVVVYASTLVAAAGGFEANIEWMKQYWGDAADNFLVRGTRNNRGTVLKLLLDKGVGEVGDPTQCHAVAIDARAPKYDGGIITRLDCVAFGIVVNKNAARFYDEGEDVWPKRHAIWGRLVAGQPDAYIIFDSSSLEMFMPSLFPPIRALSIRELAAALGLDAEALVATVTNFNAAVRPGTFDHRARRLPHRRDRAAQDPLGAAHQYPAILCLSGAPRHHLHLSRYAREQGRAHADERRQAFGQHVRRRRDHGGQRARPRLCRRHRHDHRQRVRPHRGTGGRRRCTPLRRSPRPTG